MCIRYHSQKQLQPDDYVLMFACLTLVASQIMLYIPNIDDIFWIEALILYPSPQILDSISEDPKAFYRRISRLQRMQFSSFALTWTSIFAVKICFLLFFHQLVTRLRRWILAWRIIFGITILFWALCIGAIFINCPHFGPAACK